jgi:hypothetical protein
VLTRHALSISDYAITYDAYGVQLLLETLAPPCWVEQSSAEHDRYILQDNKTQFKFYNQLYNNSFDVCRKETRMERLQTISRYDEIDVSNDALTCYDTNVNT